MGKRLVLLALSLLPAAGPAAAQDAADMLVRHRWELMVWNGAPETRDRPPDLRFADGRASGHLGCNRFMAAAHIGAATGNGGTLTFGDIGTTKMLCPGPAMHAEGRYLAALQRVTRYSVAGDRIVLEGARNLRLEYGARPAREGRP